MSTFNIHGSKTADGVVIVEGLAVVTNDLEIGRVRTERTTGCCETANHRAAQLQMGSQFFTDHDKGNAAVTQGCPCRHDHWYEVEVPAGGGTRMVLQNGERMAQRGYGIDARKSCKVAE